ncbi:hypothetical protein AruPA_14390 [Acidiphilium sp. PA]|uniref:hypothetical protein n=1 Tax=Acidiphilium sp. PA TaxID=2871705 RepID=UPI002242F4BB|nr:hypothetical protein [Acidiphilium sp. PA]MCW8308226.1 hypothetical protein [Acidiphilium sp. PA]
MPRVYVLGASGSGMTTQGDALAAALGVPHADSDDFLWLPTNPPFTTKRDTVDRRALLRAPLPVSGSWVFSGSALSWDDEIAPFYDLIVFLRLDPVERMARLRRREVARYGDRIAAGGDMAAIHTAFMEWAASYDDGGLGHRSLLSHETWLATQTTPILRLTTTDSVPSMIRTVKTLLYTDE